jgi:cell shape-determining protein MreC
MSNHKTPCSPFEIAGLEAHGLGDKIDKPSQLVDSFRQGIAWALNNNPELEALRILTNGLQNTLKKTEHQLHKSQDECEAKDTRIKELEEVLHKCKDTFDFYRKVRGSDGALAEVVQAVEAAISKEK